MWFTCLGLYKPELQCTACVSGVDVKYSLFITKVSSLVSLFWDEGYLQEEQM